MEDRFETKEILNNQSWNKTLGSIDSFYINSALVSVYNKKGGEFINIRNSLRKMYEDIYANKIKIPEIIDDAWTCTTLSRYFEKDIRDFNEKNILKGKFDKHKIQKEIREILTKLKISEVKVNYEGLKIELNIDLLKDCFFECIILTTLRGKLCSEIKLKGKEIYFSGIVVPARNLQRHEVLSLQFFLNCKINQKEIKIILSKIGKNLSKIFIDDGDNIGEYEFKDLDIVWGSFDINRGI